MLKDLFDRDPREGDNDSSLVQEILGVSDGDTAVTFPTGDTSITSLHITPGKVFIEYLGGTQHPKS